MNYFYLVGPVVYTPPKAKDFGINYIGFLRNKGNPITIHTAGGEDGVIALEDGWVELTDEQYALWVCEQHFLWFYGELVQNPLIVQTLLSVQTTLKVIIDKQAETERLAMVRP